MQSWMESTETSAEFRRQWIAWREIVYSKDNQDNVSNVIDDMIKVAVTLEELLESLRIAVEDKQREVVFKKIRELASNDFEMWFDVFRMALVNQKNNEQKIAFGEMKKTKSNFVQWRRVRQFAYIYDETKNEKAAFQEMKNRANSFTEKSIICKIMTGISKV